jgi:hypothetical protein
MGKCDSAQIGRLGGSRKNRKPSWLKLSHASNGGEIDAKSAATPITGLARTGLTNIGIQEGMFNARQFEIQTHRNAPNGRFSESVELRESHAHMN